MYIRVSVFLLFTFFIEHSSSKKWHLEPQPNDVDRGGYDEPRPDDGHICLRECERGEIPRICYYRFRLEEYTVLGSACGDCAENQTDCLNPECVTADAFVQNILTVNRRLPGPSIQVCLGDTIVVDLINDIRDSNVTIHWRGVKHFATPWMDGVPYVTQCPVLYNQTFQYHFIPLEPGTFLWHAYDGEKQLKGILGSLIVREPYTDSFRLLYDHDLPSHVVLVQDWIHQMQEVNSIQIFLRSLMGEPDYGGSQVPDAYLINGRGIELTMHKPKPVPVAEYYVHHGFRYRFRVIGGTSLTCPFRLTIQGHKLLVIAADINNVKPVLVDSLIVSSGERYDVVLNASQPVCSYWIVVEGVGHCRTASQAALLRYHGCTLDNLTSPLNAPSIPNYADRYTLNPENAECSEASMAQGICASQLLNPLPVHLRLSRQPDFRYLVRLDTSTPSDDNPPFSPYESLALTPEVPSKTTKIHAPLNAVVEILLVNTKSNTSLSCHIHGHDFYIAEQGRLATSSSDSHNLQLRLADKRLVSRFMPSKDTVAVFSGGYSLVRILADNPGFWLLQCRTDPDISAIIQVGRLSDVPPLPQDFPTCEGFNPYSMDYLTM